MYGQNQSYFCRAKSAKKAINEINDHHGMRKVSGQTVLQLPQQKNLQCLYY